jgi:hypothetical protein
MRYYTLNLNRYPARETLIYGNPHIFKPSQTPVASGQIDSVSHAHFYDSYLCDLEGTYLQSVLPNYFFILMRSWGYLQSVFPNYFFILMRSWGYLQSVLPNYFSMMFSILLMPLISPLISISPRSFGTPGSNYSTIRQHGDASSCRLHDSSFHLLADCFFSKGSPEIQHDSSRHLLADYFFSKQSPEIQV